ncbi:hypothetical protein [Homoserinimonas sp. OAct 916]|uniref:hypothetical protein n=1 Tax=Homoserinimonas sp. OAct 916 TaxID=2211450 RepID=UPI00130017D8|nr:hypothetical protein [Homoserinimonas sp. OAct 916]
MATTIGAERVRETLQHAAAEATVRLELRSENDERSSGLGEGSNHELLLFAADLDDAWRSVLRWIEIWIAIHGGDPVLEESERALVASEVEVVGAISRFARAAGLDSVHEAAHGVLNKVASQRER